MKTKAQKKILVEEGAADLKKSQAVVFADFTGIAVNDLNRFRKALKEVGGSFTVAKKRLLKFIFEKEKIEFDPNQFEGQVGVVYSPKDLVETANVVYKFSKGSEFFKILGGFDLTEKAFVAGGDVKKMGQLPTREALLGQLAFMLTVPMKKLVFVLDQQVKKSQ